MVVNQTIYIDRWPVVPQPTPRISAPSLWETFWRTSDKICESLDARYSLHRIVKGQCQLIDLFRPGIEPTYHILNSLSKVNAVFDLFDFMSMFPYFLSTQTEKRPRFYKILTVEGEKIVAKPSPVSREGKTMFRYHLEKMSYLKLVSRLSIISTLFTGSLLFLDQLKLIDLAETIGSFAPPLLSKMTLFGAILIHGTLALEAARYLHAAYNGDDTKDKTKGWLRLVLRVTCIALPLISLMGGAGAAVTAPLLIVSGLLGLATQLYTMEYKNLKKTYIQELANVNTR